MSIDHVQQPLSDDMDRFLDSLRDVVGTAYVLTDPAKVPGYLIDWTGRWEDAALAVVRPGSTEEVAAVVALCHRANVPIIPHGRITGRVHGSYPSHGSVIVSTRRLGRSKGLGRRQHVATQWRQSAPPSRQRVGAPTAY
jgi:FAD/FMN-containing dehydrogenase